MDQLQEIEKLEVIQIKKAEDQFRSMISILSNRDYFITLWPQLEAFRHAFDKYSNDAALPEIFPADEYDVESEDSDNDRKGNSTSYRDYAKSLTTRVTAYVPGAKRLVEQVDNNAALFLLILHFALCCLHRKNHVSGKALSPWMLNANMKPILPFSENRIEPVENQAVDKALSRLKKLAKLVNRSAVAEFKLEADEMKQIPEYNPGNPGMILYHKIQLENEIKMVQTKIRQFIGDERDREDGDLHGEVSRQVNNYHKRMKSPFKKLFVPPIESELTEALEELLKTYKQMSEEIRQALNEHGQREQE